ncbi:MAG: alpha/beta hydrolase, partial [Caldisericia bacterium]
MFPRFIKVILTVVLVFVSFQLYSPTPRQAEAAGWHLGNREVPGPLPPYPWAPWMPLDVQRNINYGVHNGSNQLLDFAKPTLCRDQKVPLVIFVHGGWWVGGSKGNYIYNTTAKMFYQLGFAFASIDYRLSRVADHPETINDCKLAVRYFRANADLYGIDPDKI